MAGPQPVERVHIQGLGTVDYEHLFTDTSEPGESMDAFAARLGPRLRQFSDATGFEACGVIASEGQRFGAVIGTNRSRIACANFHAKVPQGMTSTGETIHSHGVNRSVNANVNNVSVNPHPFCRPGFLLCGGVPCRRKVWGGVLMGR